MTTNKIIYILRGVPGSGKSTLAAELFEMCSAAHPSSLILSVAADDYMVDENGVYCFDVKRLGECHTQCKTQVEQVMKLGHGPIIVHNTSTTEKEVLPYIELAKTYGYRFTVLTVENWHGGKNEHGVPDEHLERMRARFFHKL